jgi:hypothetical protein
MPDGLCHSRRSISPYQSDPDGDFFLASEDVHVYKNGGGCVTCWAANDIDAIAIARQRLSDRGALAAS